MPEHSRWDVTQPFPLGSGIPLPKETAAAAKSPAESDPRLLADFWDYKVSALESLVSAATPAHAKWNARIDPTIRPSAGKIQTMALRHLAEF